MASLSQQGQETVNECPSLLSLGLTALRGVLCTSPQESRWNPAPAVLSTSHPHSYLTPYLTPAYCDQEQPLCSEGERKLRVL